MIYTEMTKAALELCFEAHRDQVDKSGLPYVFHPFHIAEQMDSEESICVALLHDVMEDTGFTVDDIRDRGMSEGVIEALLLMTHDPVIEYMEYIGNLAPNAIARKVKTADLLHNMDKSRIDHPTERDKARWDKYERALAFLQEVDSLR